MEDLPRQLTDFDRIPGSIKDDYTDFFVEEMPLYAFDGAGTHTYFQVEKAGLSTRQATRDIARALGVRQHDIGFAGQKDARAVTRQWMSVEHVEPQRLRELQIPRLHIVDVNRHHNKLRLGHLSGNRFAIKVRETPAVRLDDALRGLEELARRGAPNYFGEQRFGLRGDTWEIGRAIIRRDIDAAIDILLGRPTQDDHGNIRKARALYEQGEYEAASRLWPGLFHTERRALRALASSGGKRRRAFNAIDRATRNFFTSAYQSHLFNRVVAERTPTGLGRVAEGDLVWRHASGSVFRVEDVAGEQARADEFEISPSGPLFGYRMTNPSGWPGEIEDRVLQAEELQPDAFREGALRIKGSRRPLRFPVDSPDVALGADERGPYLELRFVLPRGCFATALLHELFDLGTTKIGESGNNEGS